MANEAAIEVELFHIILGPDGSTQTPILKPLLEKMLADGKFGNRNFKFEFITIQTVVMRKLTSAQFLHWLKKAKYILWACHSLKNDFGPLWNNSKFMNDLRELSREKGKRVFPPPEAMFAAFSQDKAEIYEALEEFMVPSFKIVRPTGPDDPVESFDEETLSKLYEYVFIILFDC